VFTNDVDFLPDSGVYSFAKSNRTVQMFKESSTQKMEHNYPVKDEGKMIRTYEPFVIQSKVTSEGLSIRYNEAFVARYYKKASYIASLQLVPETGGEGRGREGGRTLTLGW
jgi:hypothetical protein